MKTLATLIAAGCLLIAGSAWAQSNEDEESTPSQSEDADAVYADDESVPSEKCLRPKMIKSTHVLDDRNILFVMRDNKIYRNVLPMACRDLARVGAFSYPITYGRLCDIDRISVGGFGAGIDCRLGPFYPVSPAEIRAMAREAELTRELEKEKK